MFKKKKSPTEMTPEELARKQLVQKRCLWVIIILDVLVVIYLVSQILMVLL